jgi:hypothetical protein
MEAALPLMDLPDAPSLALATALKYAVEASASRYTNTSTAMVLSNPAHLHQRRLVLLHPRQPVALLRTLICQRDGLTTDATLIMPTAVYYRLSSPTQTR